MAQLKPDVLVDIQMTRYGGFDYDKSEKLIAIGRRKTRQTLLSD
jgi:NTE family protein